MICFVDPNSQTMMYAIVMMMKNPNIQDKVHEEIAKAAGDKELVTLSDKDNLPYTEATINEVWRFCNVAPLPPPRKLKEKIKIENYEIPEGTYSMCQIRFMKSAE